MKLCSDCRRTPWPFLVALFIASFAAFLTWLTLSFNQADTTQLILGVAVMFVAAGATLIHYVINCMRRHCHHGHHHGRHRVVAP
jgi:ABC-type uncharacterized transport system permease subunit